LKNIEDNRSWYLLLLFGIPSKYGENAESHMRKISKECKKVGIIIRRLFVHSKNWKDTNGRYLFRFLRYKRDDMSAIKIAESFLYGFSLSHGPIIESDHDYLILRIPDNFIRNRNDVLLEELVQLEKTRTPEERNIEFPERTIGMISSTSTDRFEAAWRVACLTFVHNNLFEATRFLKRSQDNFYVYPGQIQQVASDMELVPLTSSHQSNFEDALQNSYKAIEATIGDLPKDDRKLFLKLKQIGLDPYEEIGYRYKAQLHQVLRDMSRDRDKKSAHGSTRDRIIKAADLLNYQTCSSYIVQAAIENKKGSSIYED